jgi:hypothetical protein
MLGFISGIILAVAYRKKGPQMPLYEWMDEEDDEEEKTGMNTDQERLS